METPRPGWRTVPVGLVRCAECSSYVNKSAPPHRSGRGGLGEKDAVEQIQNRHYSSFDCLLWAVVVMGLGCGLCSLQNGRSGSRQATARLRLTARLAETV
ncbi:hypothetical protein AAFF_G00421460 [Aldrovandia affinis]|uniref:Uncharacterized protein n=1 Tax=Aldrovandia affinis TaxID=143900 RepID=A0AAD7SA26_9TELE|nr:hypothetical protein AAFF_G00421460 [Aldrovandia affinis]